MVDKTISKKDKLFFLENGYLIKRNFIDKIIIKKLIFYINKLENEFIVPRKEKGVYYTNKSDNDFNDMINNSKSENSNAVLWRIDDLERRAKDCMNIIKKEPQIHDAAENLISKNIFQYNESYVTKLPKIGKKVYWHQDPSFHIKKTNHPIATIDIYLDQSNKHNGCLWVIPGSHKIKKYNTKKILKLDGENVPGAIPVEMEPGDIAFHDNGCVHGSSKNESSYNRRIIYLAFQALEQAELGGQFSKDFINKRIKLWNNYKKEMPMN